MRYADRSDRIGGAAVAILLQAGILWVLVLGLGVTATSRRPDGQIALFTVAPPPPPPPVVPPAQHRAKSREGAAAPPNRKSTATEVQAPPPAVPVKPPPLVAAPHPNIAADPTQGAAPVAGPGSGAGGVGDGTGSGGRGEGDGDGGGADDTPPRWISGRLRFADLPQELIDRGRGGVVEVQYAVETDGHVDDCRVTRSSGDRLLDATTCRLIEQRFRYRPSRDGAGRPVRSYIVESHSWTLTSERRRDEDDDQP